MVRFLRPQLGDIEDVWALTCLIIDVHVAKRLVATVLRALCEQRLGSQREIQSLLLIHTAIVQKVRASDTTCEVLGCFVHRLPAGSPNSHGDGLQVANVTARSAKNGVEDEAAT